MKKLLCTAAVLAAALAQAASATTFPTLTTIYVIAGVKDSGDGQDTGVSTVMQCSNVSGVTTTIRFLLLSSSGSVLASKTVNNVLHGQTIEQPTEQTEAFTAELSPLISMTPVSSGVVNVESLQSGVFCNAVIVDANAIAAEMATGFHPHIVRVNPHPGTVE